MSILTETDVILRGELLITKYGNTVLINGLLDRIHFRIAAICEFNARYLDPAFGGHRGHFHLSSPGHLGGLSH